MPRRNISNVGSVSLDLAGLNDPRYSPDWQPAKRGNAQTLQKVLLWPGHYLVCLLCLLAGLNSYTWLQSKSLVDHGEHRHSQFRHNSLRPHSVHAHNNNAAPIHPEVRFVLV